jgi:ABC-2 type transport system ATP-binding protein
VERLAAVPGVDRVTAIADGLEVTAADLAPVLPRLYEAGVRPTALDLRQPTLERVFLHLTGRALRD